MKVQLPSKPFLTKSLARKAVQAVEHLTNPQICDCIEVLSSVTLSVQEKQQSRAALLLMIVASVSLGK